MSTKTMIVGITDKSEAFGFAFVFKEYREFISYDTMESIDEVNGKKLLDIKLYDIQVRYGRNSSFSDSQIKRLTHFLRIQLDDEAYDKDGADKLRKLYETHTYHKMLINSTLPLASFLLSIRNSNIIP